MGNVYVDFKVGAGNVPANTSHYILKYTLGFIKKKIDSKVGTLPAPVLKYI